MTQSGAGRVNVWCKLCTFCLPKVNKSKHESSKGQHNQIPRGMKIAGYTAHWALMRSVPITSVLVKARSDFFKSHPCACASGKLKIEVLWLWGVDIYPLIIKTQVHLSHPWWRFYSSDSLLIDPQLLTQQSLYFTCFSIKTHYTKIIFSGFFFLKFILKKRAGMLHCRYRL